VPHKIILIAVAGGLGSLARYGLSGLVHNVVGKGDFPWGTVVVNVLGCLAFGAIWASMEDRWTFTDETRTMILVGFMGAFTTFSTFVFETGQMLGGGQWLPALGNVAVQNVVGIGAFFIGLAVGRLV
jgi:CrcB protein